MVILVRRLSRSLDCSAGASVIVHSLPLAHRKRVAARSKPAVTAALWLGDSLNSGSTARSETFDNEPLTEHFVSGGMLEPHSGDSAFQVLEVQVWSFK